MKIRKGLQITVLVLVIGTLLGLSVASPAAAGTTGPAATVRVRIGVSNDSLVRVTLADLAAIGVNPTDVDPRTFALSSLGQPIAIRVVGEGDGRFDPGDEIQFFGQRFRGLEMDQKYTDERVYWLDIGGAAGPRVAEVAAPTTASPATSPTRCRILRPVIPLLCDWRRSAVTTAATPTTTIGRGSPSTA